jgi:hypothetical protein
MIPVDSRSAGRIRGRDPRRAAVPERVGAAGQRPNRRPVVRASRMLAEWSDG